MAYSRRSFLRDTGMVSLASTFGATSLLTGCCGPTSFESGVRIFFAGSWIFCGIPKVSPAPNGPAIPYMLAVAIDPYHALQPPSDTDVLHHFPYGRWDDSVTDGAVWNTTQYDHQMDLPVSTKDNPHLITVGGSYNRPACVNDLFKEANTSSRFVYLRSQPQRNAFGAHWKDSYLRIIKLPIPTRIIPAAFLEHATVCDRNSTMEACTHNRDKGVATTHIFEYKGASDIQFQLYGSQLPIDCTMTGPGPLSVCAKAGTSSASNLHFHTVPSPTCVIDLITKKVTADVPVDHPRTMFHQLVQFADDHACQDVGLEGCMMDTMRPGDLVPTSVSLAELQIPKQHSSPLSCTHKVDLATCDSGGIGVSCPPGGC